MKNTFKFFFKIFFNIFLFFILDTKRTKFSKLHTQNKFKKKTINKIKKKKKHQSIRKLYLLLLNQLVSFFSSHSDKKTIIFFIFANFCWSSFYCFKLIINHSHILLSITLKTHTHKHI